MYKTFVLINYELGKEPEVLNKLQKIENVIDIQGTYVFMILLQALNLTISFNLII